MPHARFLATMPKGLTDRNGARFVLDPTLVGNRINSSVLEGDGRVRVCVSRGHNQRGLVFYFESLEAYYQSIRKEAKPRY